jgi:hypothetical protein
MRSRPGGTNLRIPALTVFLVSVTVIAYQIALMRSLSITRYHHFSYLIISTALLGFGFSGIILGASRLKLIQNYRKSSVILLILFTLSIPVTFVITGNIGVDIPYLLRTGRGIPPLAAYIVLTVIPFFFGALYIALAIARYPSQSGTLYGINLTGSGIGGIAVILLFNHFEALLLPLKLAVIPAAAALMLIFQKTIAEKKISIIRVLFILTAAAAGIFSVIGRPEIQVDRIKSLYRIRQLQTQGDAEQIALREGAGYRVGLWHSDSFHHTLFAGPGNRHLPPEQISILLDGEEAGAVFNITGPEEAPILDSLLQSLPYRIAPGTGSALLLGETGGINIWLAKRWDVPEVDVIQHPDLMAALEEHASGLGGEVFTLPGVRVTGTSPRHFTGTAPGVYDLIQIAGAEGMPSSSSGLYSLHEDYLLTVDAVKEYISLLSETGFITLTRGIQAPPRDNIRIFSTFYQALKESGFEKPERHLMQARNYLAVTTVISASPIDTGMIHRLKEAAGEIQADLSCYPGIEGDTTPVKNKTPGPPGYPYSYYRYAADRIVSGIRPVIPDWPYKLEAVTDNSPYFHNFTPFTEALGDLFASSDSAAAGLGGFEGGYLILVLSFLITAGASVVVLIIPAAVMTKGKKLPRGKILLRYTAIGFGFMFLEMVFIQKFTLFLGDPIYSVSAVLSAILTAAGAGSILQRKISLSPKKKALSAAVLLIILIICSLFFLDPLFRLFRGTGRTIRFILSVLLLLGPSFLMGFFFPLGLEIHGDDRTGGDRGIIPAAWGVNGFASVTAAPLTVILSIAFGFQFVLAAAAFCYFICAVIDAGSAEAL